MAHRAFVGFFWCERHGWVAEPNSLGYLQGIFPAVVRQLPIANRERRLRDLLYPDLRPAPPRYPVLAVVRKKCLCRFKLHVARTLFGDGWRGHAQFLTRSTSKTGNTLVLDHRRLL